MFKYILTKNNMNNPKYKVTRQAPADVRVSWASTYTVEGIEGGATQEQAIMAFQRLKSASGEFFNHILKDGETSTFGIYDY